MTYDIVSVGAGHNNLVAAAYLAAAGKKVLVLEKNVAACGGVVTSRVTIPGFGHVMHSVLHISIQANPLTSNDELGLLSRYGLKYLASDAVFSSIDDQGRAIVSHVDVRTNPNGMF